MGRPLQMDFFDQQMNPHACPQAAFGKQFRWQRCCDRPRLIVAVTGSPKAAATNDFAVHNRFDFELLAIVFETEIGERLTTAITELFTLVQVDDLLASLQVRVISPLGYGSRWLLSAFVLRRTWLQRINEFIGAIRRRLVSSQVFQQQGLSAMVTSGRQRRKVLLPSCRPDS